MPISTSGPTSCHRKENEMQEKKYTKKQSKNKCKTTETPVVHPSAAGIDIHSTAIFIAVPPGRDEKTVRKFPTFTADLLEAIAWMKHCQVDTVAMESTGVYWIPLYQLLSDHGIQVYLVNARHVKNVPGRKTEMATVSAFCWPSPRVFPSATRDLCIAFNRSPQGKFNQDGLRAYSTYAKGS